MKKFFRYTFYSNMGWIGCGIFLLGLITVVVDLLQNKLQWEISGIFVVMGLATIWSAYQEGKEKRFVVSVKGNEIDEKIYKWVVRNRLSTMEDLNKLNDPPSFSVLNYDDLKRIEREKKQ